VTRDDVRFFPYTRICLKVLDGPSRERKLTLFGPVNTGSRETLSDFPLAWLDPAIAPPTRGDPPLREIVSPFELTDNS